MGFSSFLRGAEDEGFDEYDEFVPDHLPDPGDFLDDHDVLTGEEHVAVHETARDLFEERGVYDMTFGYNLARLNLDHRHPTAGFRYAEEAGDDAATGTLEGPVLRSEFTPTTEFCPQSDTLTLGAFRAFNGELAAHDYAMVRVRVDPMHHESTSINGKLRQLGETFAETGEIRGDVAGSSCAEEVPSERGFDGLRSGERSSGGDSDPSDTTAPF